MPGFRLIGHRGAAARYPENTREGFRQAAERGVSWVELDVRGAQDGVPVVIHDASLQRTHGRAALVRRLTGAQLSAAGVPRLDEVLADLSARGVGVYVEVKEPSDNLLERTLAAVRTTGVRAVLSSFHAELVRKARVLDASVPTMMLFSGCPRDPVGCIHAVQADEVGAAWRSVSPQAVAAWREAGIPVYAYTVNGEVAWQRAKAMGFSGVFTDDPFARSAG